MTWRDRNWLFAVATVLGLIVAVLALVALLYVPRRPPTPPRPPIHTSPAPNSPQERFDLFKKRIESKGASTLSEATQTRIKNELTAIATTSLPKDASQKALNCYGKLCVLNLWYPDQQALLD